MSLQVINIRQEWRRTCVHVVEIHLHTENKTKQTKKCRRLSESVCVTWVLCNDEPSCIKKFSVKDFFLLHKQIGKLEVYKSHTVLMLFNLVKISKFVIGTRKYLRESI